MRRGAWALLVLAGCSFGQSGAGEVVASVGQNTDSPMMGTTVADGGSMGELTTGASTSGTNLPGSTDDGATTTTSGGGTSGSSTAAMDGASSSGGGEGLVEDGLLVRYFLDDEAPGPVPADTELEDHGPGVSLDLPIIVAQGQPEFIVDADGNSGLSWTNVNNDGRPVAELDDPGGSKLLELDGATQVTLEIVAAIEQVHSMGSRFIHIGTGDTSHSLALSARGTGSLRLRTHVSNTTAVWELELDGERTVYTAVIDLELAQDDRYRLFANGSEVEPSEFLDVNALQIDSDHELSLGNRSNGDRAMEGALFYAAIYDRALSPEEVQQNADLLGDSDDEP